MNEADARNRSGSPENSKVPTPPANRRMPTPEGKSARYFGDTVYAAPYTAQYTPSEPAGAEVDMRAILNTVWRKKLTVGLVFCLCLTLAAVYLSKATRIYKSEAIIELSVRRARIMRTDDVMLTDPSPKNADQFITQIVKLERPSTRANVLQKLTAGMNLTEAQTANMMRCVKATRLTLVRRSNLVQITALHPDPEMAAKLANAYANTAIEMAYQENKQLADQAVSWLESQAEAHRKILETVENDLLKFRKENHLEFLDAQLTMGTTALGDINKQLTEVETQAGMTKDVLNLLQNLSADHKELGQLPSSLPRADEVKLRLQTLIEAESKLDALLTRYTETHPDVVAQRRVVEMARAYVETEISRAKENVRANLKLLEDQGETLRKKKTEQNNFCVDMEFKIAQTKAKLNNIERAKEAHEISYKGILRRMEEARISSDENTTTVNLIEPALPAEYPVRPRVPIVILLAILLGGIAGIGVALITHTLEDRIWSADDVTAGLGLKIIGVVPHHPRSDRGMLAIASYTDKFGIIAESFGGIRGYLDSSQFGKSFLVTSCSMEEGKTICSTNLAIASAKSGHRTLLVDLDMRRPRMARIWKMLDDKGPDLLRALGSQEEPDFKVLPRPTPVQNLDVVISRPAKDVSPAELLGSRRVREFFKWAAENYDRVIIDSPPLTVASDSMVAGGIADGVIVVCRFNATKKSTTRAAVRRLLDCGANVFGVIVNDVRLGAEGSGSHGTFDKYYAGYHYNHGYNYGITHEEEGEKAEKKTESAKKG